MPKIPDTVTQDVKARRMDDTLNDIPEMVRESDCFPIDRRREHRRRDDFPVMLGHELRNLLAPVAAAVQVLALHQATPASAQAQRALGVLARQVTHMARVVDDILAAARIYNGQLELKKAPLELGAVISSAVNTIRPLIDQRRQELTMTLPSEPLPMHADAERIAQVVSNLLSNASKYTQERGEIALSLERGEGVAVVTVSDRGTGISADFLPRVFDLFAQEDRSLARAQGGLGVGLALVRRLVELHGGTVHASSPGLGRGSAFVVRLPIGD